MKRTLLPLCALLSAFYTHADASQNKHPLTEEVNRASKDCDIESLTVFEYHPDIQLAHRNQAKKARQACALPPSKQEQSLASLKVEESDETPPSFHGIEFSRHAVEVNNGDVEVEVTLTLFEQGSKVDRALVSIEPPSEVPLSHRKSVNFDEWEAGTDANTYVAKTIVSFGANDSPGTWAAELDSTRDTSGNIGFDEVEASTIAEKGFDPYIKVANDGEIDVTVPKFESLQFSTQTADVSNDEIKLDVTVTLFEEVSDSAGVGFILNPPEGIPRGHRKTLYFSEWEKDQSTNLMTATQSLTLDRHYVEGTWSGVIETIMDGNKNFSFQQISAKELEELGANPYLTITNTNAIDVRAPEVRAVELTKQVLDVSTGELQQGVKLTLYDESGIRTSRVSLVGPSLNTKGLTYNDWQAGTEENTYVAEKFFTFDDQDKAGVWSVSINWMGDNNSNTNYDTLDAPALILAQSQPYFTLITDQGSETFDYGMTATTQQVGNEQTTEFSMSMQNGELLQLKVYGKNTTLIDEIAVQNATNGITTCTIIDGEADCRIIASTDEEKLKVSMISKTTASSDFDYTALLLPVERTLDPDWHNNYLHFELEDADQDGVTNGKDSDDDNDGVEDSEDLFPFDATESADNDQDGVGNNADNDDDNDGYSDADEQRVGTNPLDAESTPADLDGDYIPDQLDSDIDNDGVNNDEDAFPMDQTESLDTDQDGIGNNADTDDDNDGFTDEVETQVGTNPLSDQSVPADLDGDKIPDALDQDIDNDGVANDDDAFPFNAAENMDTDLDGVGNNEDTDDDGDGVSDADELSAGTDPLDKTSKPSTSNGTSTGGTSTGGTNTGTNSSSGSSSKSGGSMPLELALAGIGLVALRRRK